ncbi:MAG TPA: HD domain-containing phosphohydrolase [Dissulfurispiraceae bacterium]|nr:HD domain-containing phosphohydrolase [Dissulfurispiraceae bacterium]
MKNNITVPIVSIAGTVGMDHCILIVDDDQNILNAVRRLLLQDNLNLITASTVSDGMKIIKSKSVAVAVSDNKMQGLDGIDFLEWTKNVSPDTVRILMTGHAELRSAIEAINRGGVFRFVAKPWRNEDFRQAVLDSVSKYMVTQTLRIADDSRLLSLAQAIELRDPYTGGHCKRVAFHALSLADAIGVSDEIKRNIKHGSWLHDCGKIGIPESILTYPGLLDDEQFAIVKNHPRWGADVARNARLSQTVVNIVLCHHERLNGKGYPEGLIGNDIPFEARIVAIADTYDVLTSDRPYGKRISHESALDEIIGRKGEDFDPSLVDVFIRTFKKDTIR